MIGTLGNQVLNDDLDPNLLAYKDEDQQRCIEGLMTTAVADRRRGAPVKTSVARWRDLNETVVVLIEI